MASTLPNVSLTVQSGGLSLDPPATGTPNAKVGWCAGGTPNTTYSFSTRQALYAQLLGGPTVEAAATAIAQGAAPVLVTPVAQTSAGSCGSVTQVNPSGSTSPAMSLPAMSAVTSSGTTPPVVTLGGTPISAFNLVVQITTVGALGTAQFIYSLQGGATGTFTSPQATAASVALGATGATITFAAGTAALNNVYTAAACIPYDAYELGVTIVAGGALGTATFQFALDNLNPSGGTQSAVYTIPTSGVFVIPNTGVALSFAAGTYVAATTYAALCVAPGYSNTTLLAALAALSAQTQDWRFAHIVGQAASTSAAVTEAAAVDGQMGTDFTNSLYHFAVLENPTDTDANILSGYASFVSSSLRLGVAVGFERMVGSAPTGSTVGMTLARSSAWQACARAGAVSAGTDIAQFNLGPMPGVTYLTRDENVTPGLDAAGFITCRSFTGQPGYYLTNGRLLVPAGSSFLLFQYRRVMDLACKIVQTDMLQYLNLALRVNPNGTIFELDARNIETTVNADLANQLVNSTPQQVSAAVIAVNRTNNFVSTSQLQVTVSVQPLGYAKFINVTIGFVSSLPPAA